MIYGGDPVDGSLRQSRNKFVLYSGLYLTTHPSSALSSCSMTIFTRFCTLFLISGHHLESLPHQVDDPFSICNSSSCGIFFSRVHLQSISTTQCLSYSLDLVQTCAEISFSLHSVLTCLSCYYITTHSSNSINATNFTPCLFLFPTPPTFYYVYIFNENITNSPNSFSLYI